MSLRNAKVLVSGAGRGLGAALAVCLAEAGCEVLLTGRHLPNLQKVADAIFSRTGRRAGVHRLDIGRSDQIDAVVRAIDKSEFQLDILINNSSTWVPAQASPFSAEQVSAAVGSAITGTFLLTQALLPLLCSSERADILTIGSTSGVPGAALGNLSIPFYAAKQGQRALVDGLAELTAGTNVRGQCIHPPNLFDNTPLDGTWDQPPDPTRGQAATNRDVVEAALFALTRPRHVRVASMVLQPQGRSAS